MSQNIRIIENGNVITMPRPSSQITRETAVANTVRRFRPELRPLCVHCKSSPVVATGTLCVGCAELLDRQGRDRANREERRFQVVLLAGTVAFALVVLGLMAILSR